MFKKLLPLVLCSVLFGDRIEIMTNGVYNPEYFAQVVEKSGVQDEVVPLEMESYGPGFEKPRKGLKKWLRRVYSGEVHLEPDLKKIVLMNIPIGFYRDHHLQKLPKEKMVLFMFEPHIRLRKMYNPKLHACFSKIYTWDDDLVDNVKFFKFYYPVLLPMTEVVPFEEKKFCTLVSGHVPNLPKYPKKYPGELYSHRVKAIEFFEKVGEKGFEFYGRNWPSDCYVSYRGPCPDKTKIMKNYKFAICYENCSDAKGYVSEKIFDCFAAGVVPVYWGAPNITDYVPKDCFIDRRDFATLEDLYAFLKAMPQEEYKGYIERIGSYLKSEEAQRFSQESFEKLFIQAVSS